jgi:hypothetical protein
VVVLSDAELVRAAQRGDATSLGILLERHRALLYGIDLSTARRARGGASAPCGGTDHENVA